MSWLKKARRASRAGAWAGVALAVWAPGARADHYYIGPDQGWWYQPLNWNYSNELVPWNRLPDGTETTNISATAPATVVFDPASDPSFGVGSDPMASANPYVIDRLYVSASASLTAPMTLSVRSGELSVVADYAIIGRTHLGTVEQTGGTFSVSGATSRIELGQLSGTVGRGIYDYRGGTVKASLDQPFSATTSGIRLGSGAGSSGRMIISNPAGGGYVRGNHFHIGFQDGGASLTVGEVEFRYANGGLRPVQVMGNLSLRNDANQSARFELGLDQYPKLGAGGVPVSQGLFDVNFNTADDGMSIEGVPMNVGTIQGASGAPAASRTFWEMSGVTQLVEGSVISATYAHSTFEWTISYRGQIAWSDADDSVVGSVGSDGTGSDVVLIGLRSMVTGDADRDGDVDGADHAALVAGYGNPALTGWENGDFNADGVVDADDFTLFDVGLALLNAAGTAAVPEPSAMALMAGAGAMAMRRRR